MLVLFIFCHDVVDTIPNNEYMVTISPTFILCILTFNTVLLLRSPVLPLTLPKLHKDVLKLTAVVLNVCGNNCMEYDCEHSG